MLQGYDVTGRSPGVGGGPGVEGAVGEGDGMWLMWVLLAQGILVRKKPTTERYEILATVRLSSGGRVWCESISGSLFLLVTGVPKKA